MNPQINTIDFNQRPFIAIWEVTQACDLACVHCRASAQPERHPMELSTEEGKQLIDQIAAMQGSGLCANWRRSHQAARSL